MKYFRKEFEIFMIHGIPRNELEEYIFPEHSLSVLEEFFDYTRRDTIILGHTHVPLVKKIRDKVLFNQGSAGQPSRLYSGW